MYLFITVHRMEGAGNHVSNSENETNNQTQVRCFMYWGTLILEQAKSFCICLSQYLI